MKKGFTILFLLAFCFSACSRRDFVKAEKDDFIGFKFFLFMEFNGEKFQANGDGALMKDNFFKFRVYDNILNKHVLSFFSHSEGVNRVFFPMDGVAYQSTDKLLSRIFVECLYGLFYPVNGNQFKNNLEINDFLVDNNWLDYIIIGYYGMDFKLEVMRRFDDGKPRRIRVINEGDYMIFDIVRFQDLDFELGDVGMPVYMPLIDRPFFHWLGEIYGRG
jgi:hypothetical protein